MAEAGKPLQGKRILVLAGHFWQNVRNLIADRYSRVVPALGGELHIWALGGHGPTPAMLDARGVPWRSLGLKKHGWRLSTSRALAREIAGLGPDLVIAFSYECGIHSMRAKLYGALERLIVGYTDGRIRLSRVLMTLPYRRVPDLVTVPTTAGVRLYQRAFRFPPERMVSVFRPIDLRRFSPRPPDQDLRRELGLQGRWPVITWVARLQRQKGHLDLLRAFAAVRAKFPDAALLLPGEGRHRPAIEAAIARLGLEGSVVLPGHRSDVPEILSITDIFACPSHAETACVAVQEAMAMARPVVSTAVWGPADYLRDGRGIVVPIGDWRALADGIIRLASDSELARQMGQAARRYAEQHFSYRGFAKFVVDACARVGLIDADAAEVFEPPPERVFLDVPG